MTDTEPSSEARDWRIYTGVGRPHNGIRRLPPPPRWRTFHGEVRAERPLGPDPNVERRFGAAARGRTFQAAPETIDAVNAALYLRRPLLVTGKPGAGKSSLAYAVANELKLGRVLAWSITSRSLLQHGLYQYDALGRLHEAELHRDRAPDIGQYIRLGPLGTALLPSKRPRVLLIDEIDKSDIDLPNDLLNVFEEGAFEIPELARLPSELREVRVRPADNIGPADTVPIVEGRVVCRAFPFVVLTSNGEREFPPPFLRRCLRLDIQEPQQAELEKIVEAHLGGEALQSAGTLIGEFLKRRTRGDLATDQLLNALYLVTREHGPHGGDRDKLLAALWRYLNTESS